MLACAMSMTTMNILEAGAGGNVGSDGVALSPQEALSHLTADFGIFWRMRYTTPLSIGSDFAFSFRCVPAVSSPCHWGLRCHRSCHLLRR